MLPHLGTDRSERSGQRWVRRAAPVMAAVLLIAASVAGISYQAVAAQVDAHSDDDSAIVSHSCRHADGCNEATTKHTCRHADGCDEATTKHTCRHADGCDEQAHVSAAHPGHALPPNIAT